jgi:integrase/recombinase XerC
MRLVRNIAAMTNRPDLVGQVPTVPNERARQVIASPIELERLIASAKPWLRCAILLANNAGLRVSDVLRASAAHHDPDKRTLTIRQHKTGEMVTIPLTQALASAFALAPPPTDATPFIFRYAKKPITYHALNTAWNVLKKRAGVNPDLTFHDLRRTVAVALYEISKDLRVVEQMLGHQSLGSTVRYLEHRDPSKLKPYLDALWKPLSTEVKQ